MVSAHIMLSANTESFILPFQLGCLLFVFLVWLLWLNAGEESGHPCLFHDFRGKTFSFSSLSMTLGVSLLYMFFIMLRYVPYTNFDESFYHEYMLNFFQCFFLSLLSLLKWSYDFYTPFVNEMCYIICFVYFLVTLEWIQVDPGMWSFLCIVGFGLLIL